MLPTGIPEIGLPDIRGCIPGDGTEFYYLNFLLQVIFDAVAFSFALVPCITDWQKSLKTGLGKVLIRDGTGFFALCLAANLANIVSGAILDERSPQGTRTTEGQPWRR